MQTWGNMTRRLADSSKAIELDPSGADSWHYRSLVYLHLGQYDKAIADYTEGHRARPEKR